jgi:hypothetical protein
MRTQSRNTYDDEFKGLDPNFTSYEAIASLIQLEGARLPRTILEPACGDGAIVRPLRDSGRLVACCDIYPYEGRPADTVICNSLTTPLTRTIEVDGVSYVIEGAVTNPPYAKALAFARLLLAEFPYVALLVRSNFYVEAARRDTFFEAHPPTRVWFASLRLPMMHRYRWAGPKKSSNTAHCWLVWQRGAPREFPTRFNYRTVLGLETKKAICRPRRSTLKAA